MNRFIPPEEYLSLYDDDWQGPHYDWPRGKVSESEEAIAHIRCRYRALVFHVRPQSGAASLILWMNTISGAIRC
ncbi:sulfatase [Salmonella bongori]|nr:sulfatase [Salmonella bongori]